MSKESTKGLRIKLEELRVKSFITALSEDERNQLKGGGSCISSPPIAIAASDKD